MEGTPAQVRAALTEEEVADFDGQWQAAMAEATGSLDLANVTELLDSWRRIAVLTVMLGPAGYRDMLATAERVLRTGEPSPGSCTLEELRARSVL
jgi:hypothetical protein